MKENRGNLSDLFTSVNEDENIVEKLDDIFSKNDFSWKNNDEKFEKVSQNKEETLISKFEQEVQRNIKINKKINFFNNNNQEKIKILDLSTSWINKDKNKALRKKIYLFIDHSENISKELEIMKVNIPNLDKYKKQYLILLNNYTYKNFDKFIYFYNNNIKNHLEFTKYSTKQHNKHIAVRDWINLLEARSLENKYIQKITDQFLPEINLNYRTLIKEYYSETTTIETLLSKYDTLINKLNKLDKQITKLFINVTNVINFLGINPKRSENELQDYIIYRLAKIAQENIEISKNTSFSKLNINLEKLISVLNSIEKNLYSLTNDQKTAIKKSIELLLRNKPANCLIQGDVSSGKTIVSVVILFISSLCGYKCVYIVPRKTLRIQHLKTLKKYNDLLNTNLNIFSEDEHFNKYEVDILICGYSFVKEMKSSINFKVGIIDEIQLFGIEQRNKVQEANENINMFYTTATPHPRTKAISMIGDMEVIEIKELPPGRIPKITKTFSNDLNEEIISRIKKEHTKGYITIVVTPLVNKSGNSNYENIHIAKETYQQYFPNFNIKILHGSLSDNKKEEILLQANNSEIDILIATTSIEVGVDIKSASNIIIHYPFTKKVKWGTSQLHQLRGRVGRNNQQGYCFIEIDPSAKYDKLSPINSVCESEDVFELTKNDLNYRGFSRIIGINQSGKSGNSEMIEAYILLSKKIPEIVNNLDKEILEKIRLIALEDNIERIN